jgi:hypothetical protein
MSKVTGYTDYFKNKSKTPSQYGTAVDDDEEENDQNVTKKKTVIAGSSDLSTPTTMVDKRKEALKRRLKVAKAKVGN